MQILHIKTTKLVKKTKEELEEESRENPETRPIFFKSDLKEVPLKKPTYIVEMTMEELQLVSFYLEVEKRKPIAEIKISVPKAKSL